MDIGICQYKPIKLTTERGEVDCRYYHDHSQHPTSIAVIYVTGVGGGWGTPAGGLYPKLCGSLARIGINGLRIRYRHPTDLSESVFDILSGIVFLSEEHRIKSIGLMGHSFGGAVVIQAAIATPHTVAAIVTLATQSYGALEAISKLNQRTSKLLIHGNKDQVLPFYCSQQVYSRAHQPKQIVLYEGAGHGLNEVSDEVYELVYNWLVKNLRLSEHAA